MDDILGSKGELCEVSTGPLFWVFDTLNTIVHSKCNEAMQRQSENNKEARALRIAKKERKATGNPPSHSASGFKSQIPQPRVPATVPTPVTPQKRNASDMSSSSDTSHGKVSHHTTPTKIKSAEPSILILQTQLVSAILKEVWGKPQVPVTWARGREMNLQYSV